MSSIRFARSTFCRITVLTAALYLGGCSSSNSDGPSGTVTGSVTYEGKAVTEGIVQIYDQNTGAGGDAKIDSSGNFKLEKAIPTGEYAVTVTPPENPVSPGDTDETGEAKMKAYPNIPLGYREAETSPIKINVKGGENTLEIKMTKNGARSSDMGP